MHCTLWEDWCSGSSWFNLWCFSDAPQSGSFKLSACRAGLLDLKESLRKENLLAWENADGWNKVLSFRQDTSDRYSVCFSQQEAENSARTCEWGNILGKFADRVFKASLLVLKYWPWMTLPTIQGTCSFFAWLIHLLSWTWAVPVHASESDINFGKYSIVLKNAVTLTNGKGQSIHILSKLNQQICGCSSFESDSFDFWPFESQGNVKIHTAQWSSAIVFL